MSASSEADTTVELVAGRYRVCRTLARGGMGTVQEVLDEATGERLALKRLTPVRSKTSASATVAFFRLEYQTLQALAHPNIIRVFDYGVDAVGPYYTMELLDGQDLRALRPIGYRALCGYLRDVASSLALLHARGLLHRDVTDRNIRCTSAGHAKLIDFGAMTTVGVAKRVVGTPPYVPPEALYGQPLDGRSDLYALGVVAYVGLTGRFPYPATSFERLIERWRSQKVPPKTHLEDIPRALEELVSSLLSLDPMARPSGAAEVIDRLTAIAQLSPDDGAATAQAYLVSPKMPWRFAARHRWLAGTRSNRRLC